MNKYVIFDLDGTLLDSMPYWKGVGRDFLMRQGVMSFPDDFTDKVRAMSLEQSSEYFRKQFHIDCTVDDIVEGMKDIIASKYQQDADFKPNVLATLKELAGEKVKMCIATATYSSLVVDALTRLKAIQYFDFVLSCSDIGSGKDKPIIFNEAMRRMGGDKSNTVIVEDALHAIITAKNDGFKVVAVSDEDQAINRETIKALADRYLEVIDARTILTV